MVNLTHMVSMYLRKVINKFKICTMQFWKGIPIARKEGSMGEEEEKMNKTFLILSGVALYSYFRNSIPGLHQLKCVGFVSTKMYRKKY